MTEHTLFDDPTAIEVLNYNKLSLLSDEELLERVYQHSGTVGASDAAKILFDRVKELRNLVGSTSSAVRSYKPQ